MQNSPFFSYFQGIFKKKPSRARTLGGTDDYQWRESLLDVLDPVTRFDGRLVSASRANVGDFLADVRDAFKRSIER